MKNVTLVLLLVLLTNCVSIPFDKKEISNLESDNLQNLHLKLAYEVNDLRFDIIRQEEEVECDSTTTMEGVAYHPIGFDLGNGLFFDLNNNLSLRLDKLLLVNENEDFVLKTTYASNPKPTFRTKLNDEICFKWQGLLGTEKSYCRSIHTEDNTISLLDNKSRNIFKLEKGETETIYRYGRRLQHQLRLIKETHHKYIIQRGKRQRKATEFTFDEDNNEIILDDKYIIKKTQKLIEIYTKGRKKNYLLYSVIFGKNTILIYDSRHYGYKIEIDSNKLTTFSNNKKIYAVESI